MLRKAYLVPPTRRVVANNGTYGQSNLTPGARQWRYYSDQARIPRLGPRVTSDVAASAAWSTNPHVNG